LKQLIPTNVNFKLDEIVTKCFEGNRIADRGMSVLAVKFAMHTTEEILHDKLAHLFPMLADQVSSYQSSRNNLTIYGVTPEDSFDYSSPVQFFIRMVGYMMELESLIGEAIEIAQDDNDHATFAFLMSFLNDVVKVTNQCLLLKDKAELIGDNLILFDTTIKSIVIL
jgi:ferritin